MKHDLIKAVSQCEEVRIDGDRLVFRGSKSNQFTELFEPYQAGGVIASLAKTWLPDWFAPEEIDRPPAEPRKQLGPTHAIELLDKYSERIAAGSLPQLLKQHDAIDGVEIGPELLTILAAPPGAGKTAWASQVAFDACELDENLKVYIANAEMGFDALMRRQITKMTRINSDLIRFGNLDAGQLDQVQRAIKELKPKLERFWCFENPGMHSLITLLEEDPGLIVVDYLQKFAPADRDVRIGVNHVVSTLRELAKRGHSVLALSATKRDSKGQHGAKELSMASFKESGEIEFNADSAYALKDLGPLDSGCKYIRKVTLAHLKNRHGAKVDRELQFHMPRMEFTKLEPTPFDLGDDGGQF